MEVSTCAILVVAATPNLLGRDGALVEVELPAIVAESTERGAMGDCDGRRDAVGDEDNSFRELRDVEVMDGCRAFSTREQDVDGLLTVEDEARGAELLVLFGEEMTALLTQGRVAFGNRGLPPHDQSRICEAPSKERLIVIIAVV
jgi:hypothetical protein